MNGEQVHLLGLKRDWLGESPLWDTRDGSLWWVDTRRRLVQRRVEGMPLQQWQTPGEVGSIALSKPGHILLALESGFSELDTSTGAVTLIAPVAHPNAKMRLNDGRVDREGRFLCGSMVLHRRDPEGTLYRLDSDGSVSALPVGGVAVANSTCFSPDGRTLYFSDSLAGVIRAWDYALDGSISNERLFADTRSEGSGPDGATIDAAGCLWVALVMAAKLACYSHEGRLLKTVHVPVPYPTCPCFGGTELDTLYVTSISDSGNLLKSTDPAAGALVEITGLGTHGLPEVPYRFDA